MLYKASTLLAAATLASASAPYLDPMDPPIDRGRMEQGLVDNLHPTHSNWDYWGDGWIPKSCKERGEEHGLNANDFTIFNVHYDDCQEGWTFCRHKDAQFSELDMIDEFGRVPVKMRSFIRHFIGTPPLNDGAVAFTYGGNGDMVFESYPGVDTLIHEISHSIDYNALPDFQQPFSDSQEWQREYAKDSNTPTPYGLKSWAEDFAESAMVGVYDKVVPGGFGGLAGNWNQVFHQYATYQGYLGDTILPGGTCNKRFSNSETVPKGDRKVSAASKPDNSIKSENITIIEPNKKFENVVFVHRH